MSIALRELAENDGAWLDTWLPTVAQVVGYETTTSAALTSRLRDERGLRVSVIERDGERVGLVAYTLNAPKRASARFDLVATPAEHARKGAGMIAAALVEDEMRASGVRLAYAPAAAMHGISMYFWIRLGYAPLLKTEWPCQQEGVAWLRRSLERG